MKELASGKPVGHRLKNNIFQFFKAELIKRFFHISDITVQSHYLFVIM